MCRRRWPRSAPSSRCPRSRAPRRGAPPRGGPATVDLAAGTQPGAVLTVRGEGMPSLRRGRHGDLRVVINVVVPRRLTPEQRELLEQLNDSLTDENLHSGESIFSKLRRAFGSQAA